VTDQIGTREIVLDMLLEVLEGDKYSHTVLNQTLRRYQKLERQERAFIARIFQGTVKCCLTLDYIIDQYASLPVTKMKPLIRNLLRMSVYQLKYMDQVPVSAVCNEAVKLAKKRSFSKLSGFVNAVLRGIAREDKAITYPDPKVAPTDYLSVAYSVPRWLVTELLEQYSFPVVEAMLSDSLKEKETTIRCNKNKLTPEELKSRLRLEGVTVEETEYLDYAFKIKDYDYLEKLNAFREGLFAVQDVSSMLVNEVADIHPEDYVIDVCSAPGGKALHAAEKARKVSARDLTEYKTRLIEDNINRLGCNNIEVKVWDATQLDVEAVEAADVVIADLPCSGLGVLGKKSDIKYKLSQRQHLELIDLQRSILDKAAKYVKKGGVLIFSTCTVHSGENTGNRSWFMNNYDFKAESLDPYLMNELHSNTTKEGYLQLIQGVHPTDGFFIARFRRLS
jgi:16S rRNA (cytosine967-C5)-methyltransferase